MLQLPIRRVLSMVIALGAVVALSFSALPAGAAWPGTNGRIAFVRGGAIVSRTLGSTTTTTLVSQLGGRPVYSPDGTKIAFTRYSVGPYSWDIWVMNANGTNKRNVTRDESQYFSVSWTPNSQRLMFSEYDGNPTGARRIHTINLDGTNKRHFAPNVPGSMEDGVISPNGNHVAYVGGPTTQPALLRRVAINGDPATVRVMAPNVTYAAAPDWSPAGTHLAFSRMIEEPYRTVLYVVKNDRTGLTKIADFGADTRADDPAWSPDGTRILFGRSYASGAMQIWRTNPNGTNKARVDSNGFDPTWQPL